MQYRQLGTTDLNVSLIGLGTMTWGWQNTQAEGFEQMDYALAQGVNFFDTAEMYAIPPTPERFGTTETIIGHWFAARKNRDQVILASKITGPGLDWVRGGDNHINKKNLTLALEGSLKRLQTDYIDVYQLHWPNRGAYHFGKTWDFAPDFDAVAERENFLEVLNTLQGFIEQGKIRHFGLSNETAWGLMQYLQLAKDHNLPRAVSIQNEYSLLCRHFEPDLAEIALSEQCGLLAWSPLARGILSGKYLNGAKPAGARLTLETRPEHRTGKTVDDAAAAYIAIAKRHGLDPCQMALAFVNAQRFVTSNLIGATTMAQLKSNIDSVDLKLMPEVLADIAQARREFAQPY
ncbi:aldo/keto reductase [Marinagarivorans algicola]|uniref:aldo/keto reductase n=1 Tax=Marinagarivorans algicola TaxID=1513270 RepID=UPI0006B92AFC|nr:aldo/keto reductase [Marinagarivorans algicola]